MPLKKSNTILVIILALWCILLCQAVSAQIVARNDGEFSQPDYLIKEVLLGEGISVSNITSYGSPAQFGYFENGKSTIGLNKGIILSTGNAKYVAPKPGIADSGYTNSAKQGAGDQDLFLLSRKIPPVNGKALLPTTTADAAIIEFDFIPSSDSISFRFIFGSEEYETSKNYEESIYNDVFGFFLSGPGINGEYSSPPSFPNGSQNLAFVPGTNFPVTIRTVNKNVNKEFYISNTVAGQQETQFEYNGFTKVFTASAKVTPCFTYHIKLAIADGQAENLDSGVLLEAKSFSSATIIAQKDLGFQRNDSTSIEGCSSVRVLLTKPEKTNTSDTIYVSLNPNSTADLDDVVSIPPYIVFPPGVVSQSFPLSFINDNLKEGIEQLILNFSLFSTCANSSIQVTFYIDDVTTLEYKDTSDITLKPTCSGDLVICLAEAKGGYGNYSYKWFENGVAINNSSNSLQRFPTQNTTYTVQLFDTCGFGPVAKNFNVIIPSYSPVTVNVKDTTEIMCKGNQVVLSPTSKAGGSGVYSYTWSSGDTAISNAEVTFINPMIEGSYLLSISDQCGSKAEDSLFVKITKFNPITIVATEDTTICKNSSFELKAKITGGATPLQYAWLPGGSTQNTQLIQPLENTKYLFSVSDACGVTKTTEIFVDVNSVNAEFEYFYENNTDLKIFNYSTGKIESTIWNLDGSTISRASIPDLKAQDDLLDHVLELTVEDAAGCKDVDSQILQPPLVLYIPNSFTPDGDGLNDYFSVETGIVEAFELEIYDRWGGIVYQTNDPKFTWDGTHPKSGERLQGAYLVYLKVTRDYRTRSEQRANLMLYR